MKSTPTAGGIAGQGHDIQLKHFLARLANGVSPSSTALPWADWATHFATSPAKHAELAASATAKAMQWMAHAQHAWGGPCRHCIDPAPQDKRFSPHEWQLAPWAALSQAFLLNQQWWDEATTGVRGVSPHHEDVVAFTARQWLDMWSPSNFVMTNPQVLAATAATGGANLLRGIANLQRDALGVLTNAPPRGVDAFVPGRDVAVTPGEVVFRNHLIELIQYLPTTARVDASPVLMVPSWIMKYYILDLSPDDSLVKYMVSRGHTVFMVSWRNPGGEDRNLGMEDYVVQGVMAALEAVTARVPGQKVNAMGYCLGGTLLAIAAAALAGSREPSPLATLTLLAAQTDFTEPGELGLFIDESQIAFVEDLMAGPGYFDGRQMAGAFALINSRDLVWSRLVHEYLMGATTPMTAMRAWNADATRLPARMHSEYLRGLYLHNDLAGGRFKVRGRAVSLADIDTPMFVVATERDHVSPWQSVWKVTRQTSSHVRFVLAGGGHNVGIVNPPSGPMASSEAGYRVANIVPGRAKPDPLSWQREQAVRPGSWWPAWHEWLHAQSGRQTAPRKVKGLAGAHGPVRAPGTYVHQA